MTKTEMQNIVDTCLPLARNFYRLPIDWEIIIRYDDNGSTGMFSINTHDYERSIITIDMFYNWTPAEAWSALAHEIAHARTPHICNELPTALMLECKVDDSSQLPNSIRMALKSSQEEVAMLLEKIFLSAHPYPPLTDATQKP